MNNPIVVNLISGSGAGKSTNSARLFAMLKDRGIEAELVTEYVKDMVWEGRSKIFECQAYIFGKQLYKLVRLQGCVDVIVTDCPILLSAVYDPEQDENFKQYIVKKFNQFNNITFFLNRTKPFSPVGRNEKNIEEARANDVKALNFLTQNDIDFITVNGDEGGCHVMLDVVLKVLENILNNK